ncbi:MAG TPA: hypothetical protein VF145_02070 [Chitinophagaceae bacterium]
MKTFRDLAETQQQLLLRYPVYITLLAAAKENKPDAGEKKRALQLSHIRTYTAPEPLRDFYREAEKVFEPALNELDSILPGAANERESLITERLKEIEEITLKLDPHYASMLMESMEGFRRHVSRAHNNVLEYLIFPVSLSKVVR